MMKVLFVDDEPMVLQTLKLSMRSMRAHWEPGFAGSGEQALELMAAQRFDVVVSDMRMPGMTGAQLLNETLKRHPSTFRFILTGYVEQEEVMKCVGSTHQFLYKPFELKALREVLERAAGLRRRLRSDAIREIVAGLTVVPSVPEVYFRVMDALQSSSCSVEKLGEIVATDPGLTSKVLQLVNSAFFGFASQVSSPAEAVMLLGTGRLRSLALTFQLFSAFKVPESEDFALEQVWNHSLRVGQLAEQIARVEGADQLVVEQAFTAGLLHDVGKLILANSLRAKYLEVLARARRENRLATDLEQETFGLTHAELGASLLDLWGLPTVLVEALLWHHRPSQAGPAVFGALAAVHVANVLENDGKRSGVALPGSGIDLDFLTHLGLSHRLAVWREGLA